MNLRERYLETALIIACRLLKDDLVLKLLKHGADPNMTSKSLNCTALVATCMPDEGSAIRREKEKKEIIRHLLDQRADVNAMGGNTVYSAICAASLSTDSAIISLLTNKSVFDVPRSSGPTSDTICCSKRHLQL